MSTEGAGSGRGFTLVEPVDSDPPSDATSDAIPAIDFSTFVLSLGTSALYHLGLVADPEGGAARGEPNLVLASQGIDTLKMIAEKTRGNLEPDEEKLLESILYELRLRFVEVAK